MENVYIIRKVMVSDKGKTLNVLMTNGQSEIMEIEDKYEALKLAEILNENSDSGWVYKVISVLKDKNEL
jgi:hypothetical protein